MWHFSERDHDSMNVKDPTESTVQSHAEELSGLEIFCREVLQNAVDNPSPSNQSGRVRVSFRLHELSSTSKTRLLEAIGFDEIARHLESATRNQSLKRRNVVLPSPEAVRNPDYTMKVLTIEDYGTRGLVGPECENEKDAFTLAFPGVPHCFVGLCRNVGDSQKFGPTAGGTHGFGKTVLWKASRIRTVLFHSTLDHPYVDGEHKHYARFFGQVRLPSHYLDGNAYHGEGYLGNREEKLTRAFYDERAHECAARLGIPVRDPALTGTTIIIIDFDDPSQLEDEETATRTILGLRSSAERYFWPAIVAGRLKVDFGLGESGLPDDQAVAQPHVRDELIPLVKLYKAMDARETTGDNTVKLVDIEIPRGPGEEARSTGELAIGVRPSGSDDAGGIPTRNTAALIRGAGMVVGYWRVPRRGLAAKDYFAIALGGMAWPAESEAYDQEHFEKLLAWSEPVTHDNWTSHAEALKPWRGAPAAVKRVRDAIVTAVSELTTAVITPEGDAAPLLAGMFPLAPGETPVHEPRDTSIEITEGPHKLDADSVQQPRYGFAIRVTVPGRSEFRGQPKPDNWMVSCSYGFLGEGRHRKVVEQAKSRFTSLRINNGDWLEPAGGLDVHSVYEDEVRNEQVAYELKGETEPIQGNIASIAKHDLAVEVFRGYRR